ncbi:MAG TPA: hypothetical protein VF257_18570 [Solirubrobacteraceae bacterium]
MPFGRRRSRESGRRPLRLFFATDLHASDICFGKFLSAARVYEVDALVLGGDLTGKSLVPLVRDGSGYREGLGDGGRRLECASELRDYEAQVADLGSYPVRVERDEAEALARDHNALARTLRREAAARATQWAALAEERLSASGVRCYLTGGNDDPPEVLAALSEAAGERIEVCDGRSVEITDDTELVSVGYSNPTPWDTPREVPEPRLRELIEAAVEQADDPRRALFNIHPPPRDTGLGRCPELDTSTDPPRPVRVSGELVYTDAGSSAVRDSLLAHQPLVGLHGHIHESRAAAKLGATVVLNPGSTYREGILRGVLVTLHGTRVSYQFTSG